MNILISILIVMGPKNQNNKEKIKEEELNDLKVQ